MNCNYIVLFTNYNCRSRQLPMTIILLIQFSDWFYGLKHQQSGKTKLSSFTTKTMVHFCKGCDVHMFFCWRNYRACVIKKLAKNERLSEYLNEMFGQ